MATALCTHSLGVITPSSVRVCGLPISAMERGSLGGDCPHVNVFHICICRSFAGLVGTCTLEGEVLQKNWPFFSSTRIELTLFSLSFIFAIFPGQGKDREVTQHMIVQGQGQGSGRKQADKSWLGVQNSEPGPERSWAGGKGGPWGLKRKPGCGFSSGKLSYSRHSAANHLTVCSVHAQWHFADMLTLIRFTYWAMLGPLRSQEWPPRCLIWQENEFRCFQRVQDPQKDPPGCS